MCPKVPRCKADKQFREPVAAPLQVEKMSVGSISAAGLSQYVLTTSNPTPLQQALQSLQNSLAAGDLRGAQSAFQTLQKINQALTAAGGTSSSNASQLSTDLASLGSAISSGNLSTAQSAFATVQSDLKNASSPSLTNETNTASQSVQLVEELLSTVNVNSTSSDPDSTNSVLEQVYGSRSGLNIQA
jgi:hypothetical protein